ncbi:MAG TPA: hypothetical protein DEB17_04565 [Chlorobaculum sp.]|uniref:Uncharacterized protein n=1 Tax=Chlorobaculum tepidum (strain ATCC 49652 / DSM 12025 / NBRC 103806 / TLS) TaxID=194439 RepID=Q8KER1_CHLTE|nr:hypothetical protein CT0623 [Chlorobaculum tepidum TLS]HBU23257.1 hypothetical protein [Chlorobaculum sp.]
MKNDRSIDSTILTLAGAAKHVARHLANVMNRIPEL